MTFWTAVLAVFVGRFFYDLLDAVARVIFDRFKERQEEKKSRQIGFGSDETGMKKTGGAQARKIGFGAND